MKSLSKNIIAFALFGCLIVIPVSAKEEERGKLTFDVSKFDVNLEQAKRVSYKALLRRKWEIKEVNEKYVTSVYSSSKSKLDFSEFPKIHVSFLVSDDFDDEDEDGYDTGSKSWLLNLRKDIFFELVDCSSF